MGAHLVIVRMSFLVSAMLLLAECDLATLDHDPKTIFDDPSAYKASEELIEIIRAKDVEGFLQRAHPDALSMEDFDQKMVEFFSHFPSDEDFEMVHYYSELRKGDGEYAGIPVYLTAYDVVGEDEFSQLLLAVAPNEERWFGLFEQFSDCG